MTADVHRRVRQRAEARCEYCDLPQRHSLLSFHVEHIIPRQHGGETTMENLALACPHCNLCKGPNLTGIDPDTGEISPLFHPRRDVWKANSRRARDRIAGRTAVGRATVAVLDMNSEDQLRLRSAPVA